MSRVCALALILSLLSPPRLHAATSDPYADSRRAILIGLIIGLAVGAVAILARGPHGNSTTQIRAVMDPWVGRDINALITEWGAPSGVFPMPDGRATIYTWLYQGGTLISNVGDRFTSQSVATN